MGMLAIAPSDTNIIYAGTGEPNSRNTIEPGAGVYKSTERRRALDVHGPARDAAHRPHPVDPRNANAVYVAALGPAWKAGGDRGLYKTTDGGATWKLIKAGANDEDRRDRRPARSVESRRRLPVDVGALPHAVLAEFRAASARASSSRPTAARRGPRSRATAIPKVPRDASASRSRAAIRRSSTR